MNLDNYLNMEEKLGSDKYAIFLKIKDKLMKEGVTEKIANYQASLKALTPDKLDELHVTAIHKGKEIPAIVFFFKDNEEIDLIAKYFPISTKNGYEPQCNNPELLLAILRLLEKKE